MRLSALLLSLSALTLLAYGCTGQSPLDVPDMSTRQATGAITCNTVESRNHLLIDESNRGAAVSFADVDPSLTYQLAVTGDAATSNSGLQRDRFLQIAVWYVASGTSGRIRIFDIGSTYKVDKPQSIISACLIDPTSSSIADNIGSITLTLTQNGNPVQTRTLQPNVHCVGVGRALTIPNLSPNKGRYIIRGSQDALPARFGFPASIYETAVAAYEAGVGLSLARADLTGQTASVIQLRSTVRNAFAFFLEPAGGGVASDNFGSAQVCLEKINVVDERWGILAPENHLNVAAWESSIHMTFADNIESTIKWTGGQPKADAAKMNIQQVLVTLIKTDADDVVSQEAIALKKGETITIPDGYRNIEAWATILDEGSIADNTGTATLLVRDTSGRYEPFTVRANLNCVLVSSPEINAVGMPQVSVQPHKRNFFSWASGNATYLPPSGEPALKYDRAFLFTTDANGRQLLPIVFAPGNSVSVSPITRNGYVFFASNSSVDNREGGATIRHHF